MAKRRTQSYVTFWVGVLALCVASAAPPVSSAQTSAIDRGLALFDQGKYAEACALFTEAIAENPGNARAYRERAVCRVRLGDAKGALADSDKAI